MSELKRTPLYAFHQRHGGRMVPFGGWEMPVQYEGILAEHRAVRQQAGLFDVSHMGEALVQGPQAEAFLDHLVTNQVAGLAVGRALYTVMCQEDGGVVDDLIIYRLEEDRFFLCLNAANTAKDIAWMRQQQSPFTCDVVDLSPAYGQLALQGPKAAEILATVLPEIPEQLGRFRCLETEIKGREVLLSRTGYTGEDGFEIYCQAAHTEDLAELLMDSAPSESLTLCGLGARDSLRLEAGFPLYGHEISETISPLQGGLGWVVKLKKRSSFVGREALQRERDAGISRSVIHFRMQDRRIARQGTVVLQEAKPVGVVCSGAFSPILEHSIGSALVDRDALLASKTPLSVEVRKTRINLERARPPLHKVS